MEFAHPIVLWRELLTAFLMLVVVCVVRAVDDHIRVHNPKNLQIASTAIVLVVLVLIAHLMKAPLIGLLGGFAIFFSLIKLVEWPPISAPRYRRHTTAQ